MYRSYFKRIFDISIGLLCFTILLPVFITVTLLLLLLYRGNPFFIQVRPGINQKLFRIVKFRTMNNKVDKNGKLLPDEYRLTLFGKIIRKTSLDEIPQLINVIMGDMSLVGPRPLLPEYLPLYNEFQIQRHKVKPGITGWAQVNGRNAISWEKKFELDVWYVDNISFRLDLKIVFHTIKKVIISDGISSDTSVTMEKFKGSS